jgi:uncharacterized protein YaiE (UPF0345 family)
MARLLGRIRGLNLEPECISAKVDLIGPVEAASPLADLDACERPGIGERGKGTLAHQMNEMMQGFALFAQVSLTARAFGSVSAATMTFSTASTPSISTCVGVTECDGSDDRDTPKRTQNQQITIAGHDQFRVTVDSQLKKPVIRGILARGDALNDRHQFRICEHPPHTVEKVWR